MKCSRAFGRMRARPRTPIGGAAGLNGRACVDDRPSAVRRGARAGPEAAHTLDKSVTEAVFHAPMFALKADAEKNACAPRTLGSAAV